MMLRKPLALLLVVLLAVVTLPACDSLVDTAPEQSLPSDVVFDSPASAESVLLGAYEGLQNPGVYGGVGYMAPDISTTNAVFGGSFTTFQNIQNYQLLSSSTPARSIWSDHYEMVNIANEVIANVGDVPNIDASTAAQYEAEARFLRALGYHNLVRWFAQPYNPGGGNSQPGVPLALDPTEAPSEELNRPRSTVAGVYEQINTDLTAAADAAADLGAGGGIRAGFGSVRALQARVALYQGRYQAAADFATEVIESDAFSLLSNVQGIYSLEPTAEDVFVVSNSISDNSGTNDFPSSFYMPSDLGGRGDITVSEDLLAIYDDANDARQQELIYRNDGPSRIFGVTDAECLGDETGPCWTHKLRSANFEDDLRVIRLAEMYLTRAEANARLDNEDDALADLNEIRTRAGLDAYDAVSDIDGSLVDEVILERRRELAFEADYRHDIVRRGEPLTSGDSGGVTAPDFQRIFPIPQVEIDANGAIEDGDQNPGY